MLRYGTSLTIWQTSDYHFEYNCYRLHLQSMMEAARELAKTLKPAAVKSQSLVFHVGSSASALIKFTNAVDRTADLDSAKKLSAVWVDLREFVRAQSKVALHTANPTLDVDLGALAVDVDWKSITKGSIDNPSVQVFANLRTHLYDSVDVFRLAGGAFDYRTVARNGLVDYLGEGKVSIKKLKALQLSYKYAELESEQLKVLVQEQRKKASVITPPPFPSFGQY